MKASQASYCTWHNGFGFETFVVSSGMSYLPRTGENKDKGGERWKVARWHCWVGGTDVNAEYWDSTTLICPRGREPVILRVTTVLCVGRTCDIKCRSVEK